MVSVFSPEYEPFVPYVLFYLRVSNSFIPGRHAEFHDLGEVMLLYTNAQVPPFSVKWLSNILSPSYCFEIQGCLCHS